MLKFLKEFAIYILILALIIVIFGILFYDQLPTNKLIPIKSEYALPENLENVLEDSLSEEEQQEVLVTYTVEESDLDKYEDIEQYDPGKIDPFADYTVEENSNTITSGNQSGTSTGNSSNTNGLGGGKLTETKPGK